MATLLSTGHEAVAWLLSLARLAWTKALVFDCQVTADPKLPLAVLARIHLTFHAFFESLQGSGPVLLPDLSTLIRELRERRLVCPCLPPSMQGLLTSPGATGQANSSQNSTADSNPSPVSCLQIGPGQNLGACIWTAASTRKPITMMDDGQRSFCLAFHFVGWCNMNCGGKSTHHPHSRLKEQCLSS
jgi:hypothetical protein